MRRRAIIAVIVLTLLGFGMGLVFLGVDRTVRITATAALVQWVDGQVERPFASTLPVFDVRLAESDLAALNSDLPWSGGNSHPATVRHHGRNHPVMLRYRGLVVTSHYLGAKKSFRVAFEGESPFGRIQRMNFINPKTPDMLNVHMALWLARSMGVAVPYDDFALVSMNGGEPGVFEMTEQIDGTFEQGPGGGEVPVFKGDYPAAKDRTIPERRALWKDAAHWVFTGEADSTEAMFTLQRLVRWIGLVDSSDSLRGQLPELLDIEGYLRYCAALQTIGTLHIDNYHNQWLVMDPAAGRFHPVMWDPLLLFPFDGEPWYPIHDALAYHVLAEPRWRLARDRYIWQALLDLHRRGAFDRELTRMLDRIRPAVLADRSKCTGITDNNMDVFPYSAVQFARAADALRTGMAAYWDRLEQQCTVRELQVTRGAGTLRVRSKGPCALQLSWPEPVRLRTPLPANAWLDHEKGTTTLTIVPDVEQAGAERGSVFADGSWYEPAPVDLMLVFEGEIPGGLRFANAITGGTLDPTRQ